MSISALIYVIRYVGSTIDTSDNILLGTECVILAIILCANDYVAMLSIIKEEFYPKLNSILFGEGIIKNALSILIFDTVQKVFLNNISNDSTTKDQVIFTGGDFGMALL